MWPGLVGKEEGTDEPPISLDRMLELTKAATHNGENYDGVDLFLFFPHLDIDGKKEDAFAIADKIQSYGFDIGSLVAPVWEPTGGGSAMGSEEERGKFLDAVKKACRYAGYLNEHGARKYGSIRIDSACGAEGFAEDAAGNMKKIAETFKEAGKIAADHGEKLVAEGEICWGGMQSWKHMKELLEAVDMKGTVGLQADMAHTYLYLMGYNCPEHALLKEGYSEEEFWEAYKIMTDALAPWVMDFHVAQNDGSVHGTGSHDKTGRHCAPFAENGKLDVVKCSSYWLFDEKGNKRSEDLKHLCWDGCMFPNKVMEEGTIWTDILNIMMQVRDQKPAQVTA
jgi:sugar phosphate isomerase/epimerase